MCWPITDWGVHPSRQWLNETAWHHDVPWLLVAVYVIIGFASISIPCSITNRASKSLTGDENLVNLTRHPSHPLPFMPPNTMPHMISHLNWAKVLSFHIPEFQYLWFLVFFASDPTQPFCITSATSSPAPEEKSAEDAGRAAYSTAMAVAWLRAFWGILPLKIMVNGIWVWINTYRYHF